MDRLPECALFVLGLIFGSFLNVCISRIPRDESVVSPPSHCPSCGARIRWYGNIPLLSWALLRGRCRACKQRISLRYPSVELLTAITFAACGGSFGLSWPTLKFCLFAFLLIGLIFMDAETGLLPREFTYTGIVAGLILSWSAHTDSAATSFLLRIFGKSIADPNRLSLADAFVGAMVGAGFFYLAWALYYLVRRAHGLGFGDIALMAMSGAFLGMKMIVLVIVLAPLASVIYVGLLLIHDSFQRRSDHVDESYENRPFLKREIPFGDFTTHS